MGVPGGPPTAFRDVVSPDLPCVSCVLCVVWVCLLGVVGVSFVCVCVCAQEGGRDIEVKCSQGRPVHCSRGLSRFNGRNADNGK